MLGEVGHFALILAFAVACAQAVVPMLGAARADPALMAFGRAAAVLQFGLAAAAFAALMALFAIPDFSVALVANHSHTTQPLIYRLGATWGNHEGSMLLWILILALFGALVALLARDMRETLQARVLAVQAFMGALFLAFLLLTSNPFARLSPAPLDGAELNPLLQDPGLILHPPLLYIGYVGFSVAFAFAVAALIEGRADAAWARWIRPWVLVAWISLTAGIALGSHWAYYELGWGGWWFWDPVENASLMPWLLGTALLHCISVLERRGALISWTLLLAILTFSLSLIGTFLVRSGVLTSVHAFAVDPERGVFILGMIVGLTGAALALFAWRAPALRSGALFGTISRESGLVANNILLSAATGTVFLGTFYPVLMDALRSDKISVGPPYYVATFAPIMGLLLFVLSAGPMLQWRRDRLASVWQRVRGPALAGIAALAGAIVAFGIGRVVTALGFGLALWAIAGAAAVLARRWRIADGSGAGLGRRILRTPRPVVGLVLAHAGLGVLAAGATAMGAFALDKVQMMRPGETVAIGGASVRLDRLRQADGPNYRAVAADFTVTRGRSVNAITSEKRLYPVAGSATTEAAIDGGFFANTYVAIGDAGENAPPTDGVVVRLYWHPLVSWIWGGCLLMAAGGLISLTDQRYRIGAAAARPATPAPLSAPVPVAVPAE